MQATFTEAVSRLSAGIGPTVTYALGSAWFADDEEYDRQSEQLAEATAALTKVYGEPTKQQFRFPAYDVDRAVCWPQDDKILFVLLVFEDNTRVRRLLMGVCPRGEVQVVPGYWS